MQGLRGLLWEAGWELLQGLGRWGSGAAVSLASLRSACWLCESPQAIFS